MKKVTLLSASLLFAFGLAACSSGSSTTTTTASTTGLSLPTEISAVPTDQTSSSKVGLKSTLMAFKAATDAGTDYSKATTQKWVNEHTLEQFEIIEEVMDALAQTHYADALNINNGPYKAMVAWTDEENGVSTKVLEPWIVQSDIIIEDGAEVTRARAWIEEVDEGEKQLVKAEFKIFASATQAADGSFDNYGVWTLNVKFGDQVTDFFAASAEIGANGESIIKVHENFQESPSFTYVVKAILNKSATNGFGKVSFPDWESCMEFDCTPSQVEAKYAYDASHLAVQKTGDSAATFKNRSSITEMTHRYGLYDSATGDDIMRTKSFGFPVFFTGAGDFKDYAYYGAWQGRHQLWSGSDVVAAGTTVTREDHSSNATPVQYTVSAAFKGTLTKRIPTAASLSDVENIPVETWTNENLMLVWDNALNTNAWTKCVDPDWSGGPLVCDGTKSSAYTDFGPITYSENSRAFININKCSGTCTDYQYLPASHASASGGAGFYTATMDQATGGYTFGSLYTPTSGDELWVNIGGSIYIEYKGVGPGWVQKTLTNFDMRTWTPEFDPSGDSPYTLPVNRELYINAQGTNYIVESDGTTTTVKIELQSVANPLNATTFVPTGSEFMEEWGTWGDSSMSTFQFDVDSASTNYMKLVYKTVGSNDTGLLDVDGGAVGVGDVANRNFWGLKTRVGVTDSPTQYNWDYPREGENWGIVQYLIDADSAFVLLSDPVQMKPITVTNNAGDSKTVSLQYDGWMHGLPDLFEDLRKNGFVIDAKIADKIINIPAATAATDALDSTKSYLIKPLEVSQFLNIVADPGTLDITVADAVDLNTVPNFVEHGMGTMPVVENPRYSEGILVE